MNTRRYENMENIIHQEEIKVRLGGNPILVQNFDVDIQ